jgi:hypothetical protein
VPETFTYLGTRLSAEVKAQFGDTGNVQITDAHILNWINNGQRQICASNPWNEKVFATNLLADQATYDLNALMLTDRVMNYSSIIIGDRRIDVIPWAEYLMKVQGSTPAVGSDRTPILASEYGGVLTLYPTPSASTVNGITIYYVAWPEDLAALTDQLTIPDRFYNALSRYVLSQALELDENFEAAQIVLQQHQDAVSAELQRDKMDPTDFYPAVTYDGGDW